MHKSVLLYQMICRYKVLFFLYNNNFRNMPLASGVKITEVHIPLSSGKVCYTVQRQKTESVSKGTILQFLQILKFQGLNFTQIYILNIPLANKYYTFLFMPCDLIITYCFLSEDAIKIFIKLYNETIIFIKLFTKMFAFNIQSIKLM